MNKADYFLSRLQESGEIPFADFMQLALYDPLHGYYSSDLSKFGQGGDFTTAPELNPIFAQTLANQCQEILRRLPQPACILEFGAGSGRLCVELLKQLEKLGSLPQRYYILEVSGVLQQRQAHHIQAEIPHLFARIEWLHQWPQTPLNGVFLANEVLDAMPVHRFLQTAEELYESMVHVDGQKIMEDFKPCQNAALQRHVASVLTNIPLPYLSEVNLLLSGWMQECARCLVAGVLLIIDYGFPQHEFYHPDRQQGTLMCHYQHRSHTNPFAHIGEQDITTHVDFTQVATAAVDAGLEVLGYTNQAAFLLANGLLSLLNEISDERERFNANQAAKTLLQPAEMGELFKVIALGKNFPLPLQGFQLADKRMSL